MLTPFTRPAAFDAAECDRILALAAEEGFAEAALVGGTRDAAIRRARITWLDDSDPAAWVMARIVDIVAEANRAAFDFALTDFAERLQLARYDAEEEGHFAWHSDTGSGPLAERRKLTIVVQLSDPESYAGGTLELNPDARIRSADRSRGSATLFPAFTLHRVTPVTSGARFSLTTWVHGPRFR